VMKSLGTSGSATRRVFSYKVGCTLEEICLEQVLWTWDFRRFQGPVF
jgi:hypothetical protein